MFDTRVLYTGTRNASSWAFRAWLALTELGIAFEERVVDIRKPQRFDNLARVGEFSPPAAVPVLVDGDAVIYDSLAIMEYANDLGGGALLPAEITARARARSLLAWQHAGLSNLCPRLSLESAFYSDRRAMTADEVADANRLFTALEKSLRDSDGPYLVGELSLADLAFVPTVVRLMSHRPDTTAFALIGAWGERLLARDSVRAWMDEARTLPPVVFDGYRN